MAKPTKKDQEATKKALEAKESLVAEMRAHYDQYTTYENHNTTAALEDLKLLVGEGHWDQKVLDERKEDGRPSLVVNQLPVFTRQVIGDQRQSRPNTKVIPSDQAATPANAEKIESKLREIKYISKADAAHDNAFGQAVRSGFGYWRIKTDYESDETTDQCVRITSIPNQFGVKFDPLSTQWDKLDANWLIVETMISKDAFKAKYPDHTPTTDTLWGDGLLEWYNEDGVRIVEYFKKEHKPPKTLWLMSMATDDGMEEVNSTDDPDEKARLEEQGFTVKKQRKVNAYEIVRYLMCGFDILEDKEVWPSKYWPVIEVLGETVNVNGKVYKRSLIRDAHDSQRGFNYAISSEVETFSLAPKTPYVGTVKQFQGFENKWRQAHKRTFAYLPFNADPTFPSPPQRVDPPQLSSAMVSFRTEQKQNLRDVVGIFDAGLGNQSNEVSGVAIEGRKRESDTGTYIYMDNLQYALELEDRTIIDLIPKIYDTNRSVMTRSADNESIPIEINKPVVVDGQQIIENDFTSGKYDVVVTLGPSASTQRQESRNNMLELIRVAPELAPFVADKLVRSMDFHDAQDIAQRILKGIVPRQVLSEEELKDLPQAEQPQGPDPLVLAQMQLAETQSKLNLARAEKALADVMKVKEEIQVQQSEMTFKVMKEIDAKLMGMGGPGQGGPQGPQMPQGGSLGGEQFGQGG
ncbi:MAG: portal protein [Methanoregula sp.]